MCMKTQWLHFKEKSCFWCDVHDHWSRSTTTVPWPNEIFFLKHTHQWRCLCSTWSGPNWSSMVVRIVGGPTFHGGSGGYSGEQPEVKDLLARSGGFCLSNWRNSEVRRRKSNSGGSGKFLTTVISLQSIWKLRISSLSPLSLFYAIVASRMIIVILDLYTEEDALASKACFKIYQSWGSSQQKTTPVENYRFKCMYSMTDDI